MKPRTVGDLGERRLIELIRKCFPARGPGVLLGIGDDTAVLRPGKKPLLLTKDLLVEDVDFRRRSHPAFFIGRKSLAVNLSDIAAMGGTPRAALLGLGLPSGLEWNWVKDFLRGFAAAGRDYGIDLAGGDISKAREIVVSVTVVGAGETPVKRSGARPGHELWVSGTPGDAALGFALIEAGAGPGVRGSKSGPVKAFLDPVPRLSLGRALARRRLASAMIDVSDGLSVDLAHLTAESGVGAEIELERLPLSAGLRTWGGERMLAYALHGGEDFELLFTTAPSARNAAALAALARRQTLTRIGRIVKGRGVVTVDGAGRRAPLAVRGYEHFRA